MIPSEQLEKVAKQIDNLGAEVRINRKEFEMYKNSVSKEKNDMKQIMVQAQHLTKDV